MKLLITTGYKKEQIKTTEVSTKKEQIKTTEVSTALL